jgi:hypothetical protein
LSGWFRAFSKSWCWEEEESPYGAATRRGEGVKREETMEEGSANMQHVATVVQAAAASVSTASTKQRVTIFQATIPSVLFPPSGGGRECFSSFVGDLVELIFSTLSLYDDRASQVAVEHVIVKALKEDEPVFVKAFASVLVQTAERIGKSSSGTVQLKLLRWSCLLINHNPAILLAKSAFFRLAAMQGSLLFELSQGNTTVRLRQSSQRIFLHLLSEVPMQIA